jgi:hypothetical protein
MRARLNELTSRRSALLTRSAYFTALAVIQLDLRQAVECLRLAGDARELELALGVMSDKLRARLRYLDSIHSHQKKAPLAGLNAGVAVFET